LERIAALLAGALPSPITQPVANLLIDELCLQQLSDRRLESLIATFAPGCVGGETVLRVIEELIRRVITPLGGAQCVEPELTPPPTVPTSLRIFDRLAPFVPEPPPGPRVGGRR
jgi:hypothetical protein